MKIRNLGPLAVSELGYGTMNFANYYGASPERSEPSASSAARTSAA